MDGRRLHLGLSRSQATFMTWLQAEEAAVMAMLMLMAATPATVATTATVATSTTAASNFVSRHAKLSMLHINTALSMLLFLLQLLLLLPVPVPVPLVVVAIWLEGAARLLVYFSGSISLQPGRNRANNVAAPCCSSPEIYPCHRVCLSIPVFIFFGYHST